MSKRGEGVSISKVRLMILSCIIFVVLSFALIEHLDSWALLLPVLIIIAIVNVKFYSRIDEAKCFCCGKQPYERETLHSVLLNGKCPKCQSYLE